MTNLTANQKSFIKLMLKSEEHARRGFELLLRRPDFDKFFEALAAEGLFAPEQNPPPVPVEPDGSVRIPYWAALSYLSECAKRANDKNDLVLANSVLGVVRSVSESRDPDGRVRDNFHTFRIFAQMLGTLPLGAVTTRDVELAAVWLGSRFNRDMVAHALDEGAIRRFLASDVPEHWGNAVRLLRHCLALSWQVNTKRGVNEEEPVALISPHWLTQLLSHHATDFGRRVGLESATILRDCVAEVFSKGGRASWSYVSRPAVEDHRQNGVLKDAADCFVEGLRDVTLSWCDTDAAGATPFVKDLLRSDVAMLRRIGIYALSERWNVLRALYLDVASYELFDLGHIHELYGLLKSHFEQFGPEERAATLRAIRNIPAPDGDDSQNRLELIQRRWLSAVIGTALLSEDPWVAELSAQSDIGASDHPDFITYHEVAWGHGPTPYPVQELIVFAEQQSIVAKLNDFRAQRVWRGPTIESLVEALEQAVMAAPEVFTRILPTFIDAGVPYQTGVVSGFKRLLESPKSEDQSPNWVVIWSGLLDFLERLLGDPTVGTRASAVGYFTDSWLISVIADLLHSSTRDDNDSFPVSLLPRRWALLEVLADRAETGQAEDKDPMTQAINSPKGRTVEALFGHLLGECRISDKESGSHNEAWARRRPLFEKELGKCQYGNFEFSTLAGAYIANLEYIDVEWLRARTLQLFPSELPVNFRCAIGGLAYSLATSRNYAILRDAGVLDKALHSQQLGGYSREKLVERVLLGYLWEQETLASPRVSYFFDNNRVDDLEAACRFLWSVRDEPLTEDQKARVVDFWERCITWARVQPSPPSKILSSLGDLAWSLTDAAGRNRDLLLAVAPHMGLHHGTHEFLGELRRLVEVNPVEVCAVLEKLLATYEPIYDYEDQLAQLVARLAELGQREVAIRYCNRCRAVPGMATLFDKLTARP